MSAKFTRGPWEVHPTRGWIRAMDIPANGGDVICLEPDVERSSENWRDGNAHLIAAAPDLYAALERLARDADQWSGQIEPPLPSLQQAWDALTKARGENA